MTNEIKDFTVNVLDKDYEITVLKTIDETSSQPVIKFSSNINDTPVQFRATYNMSTATELSENYNIDLVNELINVIKSEIRLEIFMKVTENLRTIQCSQEKMLTLNEIHQKVINNEDIKDNSVYDLYRKEFPSLIQQ